MTYMIRLLNPVSRYVHIDFDNGSCYTKKITFTICGILSHDFGMPDQVELVPSSVGKPSSSPGSRYPPAGFAPRVRSSTMFDLSMASRSSVSAQGCQHNTTPSVEMWHWNSPSWASESADSPSMGSSTTSASELTGTGSFL